VEKLFGSCIRKRLFLTKHYNNKKAAPFHSPIDALSNYNISYSDNTPHFDPLMVPDVYINNIFLYCLVPLDA